MSPVLPAYWRIELDGGVGELFLPPCLSAGDIEDLEDLVLLIQRQTRRFSQESLAAAQAIALGCGAKGSPRYELVKP